MFPSTLNSGHGLQSNATGSSFPLINSPVNPPVRAPANPSGLGHQPGAHQLHYGLPSTGPASDLRPAMRVGEPGTIPSSSAFSYQASDHPHGLHSARAGFGVLVPPEVQPPGSHGNEQPNSESRFSATARSTSRSEVAATPPGFEKPEVPYQRIRRAAPQALKRGASFKVPNRDQEFIHGPSNKVPSFGLRLPTLLTGPAVHPASSVGKAKLTSSPILPEAALPTSTDSAGTSATSLAPAPITPKRGTPRRASFATPHHGTSRRSGATNIPAPLVTSSGGASRRGGLTTTHKGSSQAAAIVIDEDDDDNDDDDDDDNDDDEVPSPSPADRRPAIRRTSAPKPKGWSWTYSPPNAFARHAQAAAAPLIRSSDIVIFSAEHDFFLAQLSRDARPEESVEWFRRQFGAKVRTMDDDGTIKNQDILKRANKLWKMSDERVDSELERRWGWPSGAMSRRNAEWKRKRVEAQGRNVEMKHMAAKPTSELEMEQEAIMREAREKWNSSAQARDVADAERMFAEM